MISYKTKSLLAAVTLAISLLSVPFAWAAGTQAADAMAASTESVKEGADRQASGKRQQVLAEATQAIRETQDALKALDEENPKEALAALERATGKLEIILARQPDLAMAPAGVSTTTYDVVATAEAIEELRDASEDALQEGRLQDARRLIQDLASEVVISVTHIPLASYPDAIRQAARLIEEQKLDAAAGVLSTALRTLVVTDTIIPLPVVTARELLEDAAALAQKDERSEEEESALESYLAEAREELEFAELLGYGSEHEFASLYEQLDEIGDRVDDGSSSQGLFARVRDLLDAAVDSSQPEATG